MGKAVDAAIYRGEVVHARLHPVAHKLCYRVFSLLLDVNRVSETGKRLRLFSIDRFNLFSLHQRDHGHRDGSTLAQFVADQICEAGLESRIARSVVLLYPRILGFAFNPLTVYWCLDASGEPLLMIYEVRNTFGEDVTYVLKAGERHGVAWTHGIAKAFYVSPFNDVEGDYTFHVTAPVDELTIGVALKTGRPILRTHFRATATALTDAALLKMFFAYPAMTAKIVGGIHWEAAKLWLKGMTLKTRPAPPEPRILRG